MKVKYSEYFKPGDLVKRAITGIVKEGVQAFPVYICDVVCGYPVQIDLDWYIPVLSKRKEWGGAGPIHVKLIHHALPGSEFPPFFLEESKRLRIKYGVTDEVL